MMRILKIILMTKFLCSGVIGLTQVDTLKKQNYAVGARCETDPQFPGGETKLYSFLKLVKKHPVSLKEKGIEGKVFVQFLVGKTGKISNIVVKKSSDSLFIKEAIRIVKLLPNWVPGKNCVGDTVEVRMIMPIVFKINNDHVFRAVDTMPSFPGGDSKLFEFLGQNLKFSQPNRDLRLTSKYYFEFIVEKDGSISNLKQLRGRDEGFFEHVIGMVHKMPKWNPGKLNGEPVRVKMVLPIGIHWR